MRNHLFKSFIKNRIGLVFRISFSHGQFLPTTQLSITRQLPTREGEVHHGVPLRHVKPLTFIDSREFATPLKYNCAFPSQKEVLLQSPINVLYLTTCSYSIKVIKNTSHPTDSRTHPRVIKKKTGQSPAF